MELREKFKELVTNIGTQEDQIEENSVANFILDLETLDDDRYNDIGISNSSSDCISFSDDRGQRKKLKIGKFINKFENDYTARQIEIFVNKYKAEVEFILLEKKISILKGKEFLQAYKTSNYAKMSGSIGSSCMNNMGVSRLGLYVENDHRARIAVLKDNNGKILARGILWRMVHLRIGKTAKERNEGDAIKGTVLDRVYCVEDKYAEVLKKWARKKGYYYRVRGTELITPEGVSSEVRFKIKLKKWKNVGRPYLDTMSQIKANGWVSNRPWKK